ncbi:ubiquitin-like-specific protease ESD4 [Bidens hawaiensis]|uniref:ubiquitin-like-specific protease ESD4 n=1 Tax=Bidens hawaiensis TaxID=980011 RepID=UPI004049FE7F
MEDFEAVFTLDWLSGSVVTSYMMFLYERIKNGPIQDHGICFVTVTATMTDDRKMRSIHIDESSKIIADCLTKRNKNDIVMVPYNPGKHWVLAVLDMKTTTSYYLDSLRPIDVNPQLRQIIDAAMALYAVKTGSNSRCPKQPGSIECGYYILNFMKEIVREGLEILVNNNVGGDKEEYKEADFDEVRKEWSSYATQFVFRL